MQITWAISSETSKVMEFIDEPCKEVPNKKAMTRISAEFNLTIEKEKELYTELKALAYKILAYKISIS